MQILNKILKIIGIILALPVLYIVIAIILSYVPVNNAQTLEEKSKTVYLSTNGVHLDIVIPMDVVSPALLDGLHHQPFDQYISFGWGDENFYIHTPEWSDLSVSTAFKALFIDSPSLMHVTRYTIKQKDWIAVAVTEKELKKLNQYILESFQENASGQKVILENQGYTSYDDFYKANGSYSLFNSCNTWVNRAFKSSGLKACQWTAFDFPLIQKYQKPNHQ